MPTYTSSILLKINLTAGTTSLNTEQFTEAVVDELHDILDVHLTESADSFEIDFESVTTELVTPPPSESNYTSMASLNAPQATSAYTPMMPSSSNTSGYTPLTR